MNRFANKQTVMELIKYIIFGVLTTLVSLGSFLLFESILGENRYLFTNIISWVISVAFAFVTNKIWVFNSKSRHRTTVLKEAASFAGARLFSLGMEEAGLWLLISVLGMEKMQPLALFGFNINGNLIAKCIMTVVVVILNYVFSKFVIFHQKEQHDEE